MTRKPFKRVLILTDNLFLFKQFKKIIDGLKFSSTTFTYKYSFVNKDFEKRFRKDKSFRPLNVKTGYQSIIDNFDLVISLHSKQLFPKELVTGVKCINIHPGFNPYNRGWFPQVFSIINKLPLGATIHEIDEKIDHGPIIVQEQIPLYSWDTSLTAYDRVLAVEIKLISKNIRKIINNTYSSKKMRTEGNLNLKKDFNNLCQIDLTKTTNNQKFIDRLRALTHGQYSNAFFIDKITGKKVYISVNLKTNE